MKTGLCPKHESGEDEALVVLLTGRQQEILKLISIGHTNREIAVILHISVRTVEVHRFHLMRRLNVRNVAQLLGRALHLGLLSSRLIRARAGDRGFGKVVPLPVERTHPKGTTGHVSHSMKKVKLNGV